MAGGVPITSLQDMLLLQQINNNADPLYSGLKAFSDGVAQSIAQKQQDAINKKKEQEAFDIETKRADDFARTNKDSIQRMTTFGKNGRTDTFKPIKKSTQTPIVNVWDMPEPEGYDINPNYGKANGVRPYVKETSIKKLPTQDEVTSVRDNVPDGWIFNQNYGIVANAKPYLQNKGKKYKTLENIGVNIDTDNKEELRQDLENKDPTYSALLKGYANGDLKLPGRGSTRQIDLLQDIAFTYPGFDQANYNVRYNTKKDFTSGKSASNIKSLNTAVDHLGSLYNIIPELENSKYRKYNTIDNLIKSEVGNPVIDKFKITRSAVSDELATIFKGSSGTDIGIAEMRDAIDMASSPEALKAVVGQAVKLMQGRMGALQSQWDNTFKGESDFPIISDKSKKILEELGYPINYNDSTIDSNNFGLRADGTKKGMGYLGIINRPDGRIMTELSIGVNLDGKETEIPTLVPTLTKEEINYLRNGGKPTKTIIDKAVSFARNRIRQGKSPFASAEENNDPLGLFK